MIWLGIAAVFYIGTVVTGVYTLNWLLVPITIAGLVIPVMVLTRIKRDKELSEAEQSKMSGYIWFFVAAAIFWMIYDQGGSTLAIFAESSAENSVFGWDFPVSWYQSVNPVLIMALAPVFAAFWLALNRRGKEPSTIVKFSSGLVLVGASFFVFLMPPDHRRETYGHKAAAMWLVAIYFIQTVAELALSPYGRPRLGRVEDGSGALSWPWLSAWSAASATG
ncbi:MFS transporter OS=Streptomyces microflavus OX=1919 GN=Smic_29760 PE=3 SV=1 [Streptomyces microflavus]